MHRRGELGKLRSLELFRELSASGAFAFPRLPAELTIETTAMAPEEAARTIVRGLGLRSVDE